MDVGVGVGVDVGVDVGVGVAVAIDPLGEGTAPDELGVAGPGLPLGAAQATSSITITKMVDDLRPNMAMPPKQTRYRPQLVLRGRRRHLPEVTERSANQTESWMGATYRRPISRSGCARSTV
ncbi:MAG TPA: hypothetical protein VFP66_09320 [Candidatus Limnocylindrales bacterium]|nr:hypothetical protein [Candidatus Limnocylindrales bacterium]